MNTLKAFQEFVKDVFPGEEIDIDVNKAVSEFEEFYPDVVKIIQKDDEFFNVERIVFGRNISVIQPRDALWTNLFGCMLASFLHGDIRKKTEKVLGLIKNFWNASGQENEEMTRILNDEKSESRFKELIDFVLNTRIVKVCKNMLETFDFSDIELNVEDPREIIEMIKDPDNPIVNKLKKRVETAIQDRIRRGELSPQMIEQEIEMVKRKALGIFGNMFNDALGGRRADVPSAVLTGNSPEARRQRMLARMQRKLDEKNSK